MRAESGRGGAEASARDRAMGALVGLACGDALGTTLEFKAPGTFAPIDDMLGGGPFGLRPGQWTDDTSMALCLAESILDTAGMDPVDQLRRYVMWWREGYLSSTGECFDIGNTTITQLRRFAATGEPFDPNPNQEAAANGSLMRLAPVPIRWHTDAEESAERAAESSRTTHAAARPTDACRVMSAMVASLIVGADVGEVLDPGFWKWGNLHPEVEAVARGSWRAKEPPAIRGTGYCVDALEAALWAVGGAADFRDAVLRAANLGDDADTTAAIAGQLAGARWGASGIPDAWREHLAAADRVEGLASALYDAGAGTTPDARWTHDGLFHAWWVEPGRLLAGEYPGHPDPRRATTKLNLLADAGIRTVIDLTTEHDGLDPYAVHLERVASDRKIDLTRIHFPIPDLSVIDATGYDAILNAIAEARDTGRGVFVHCWGGVGRTGTVIGCYLADHGLAGDAALGRLAELRRSTRKAHRDAPETEEQRDVIRRRAPADRPASGWSQPG